MELLIFKRYQLDVKDIKCLLQIKKQKSLARILTNLKRCPLQTENFEKLIFVNKNWPNDLKIGCKSPSSSMERAQWNSLKRMLI
jgi:hypothetical protein